MKKEAIEKIKELQGKEEGKGWIVANEKIAQVDKKKCKNKFQFSLVYNNNMKGKAWFTKIL
jgi:hypothetical protein